MSVRRAASRQLRLLGNYLPRWVGSIRFRLSLVFSFAVFTAGFLLVGGIYLYQLSRLDEPMLMTQGKVVIQSERAGEEFVSEYPVVPSDELAQNYLLNFEAEARRAALNDWRVVSLRGLGVLFVVAFATGWFASGWVLKPLGRMVTTARGIGPGELSQRVALGGPHDELKELADTFDGMLDRIQDLVETNRRFVQDISHELRNPLAVAQANLELAIDDPNVDLEGALGAARLAHGANNRVAALVDDLLSQARSGMPERKLDLFDPAELCTEIVAETRAQAEALGVVVMLHLPPPDSSQSMVRGDRAAVRRAIVNLVANALRYAPAGTSVDLGAARDGEWVVVGVRDQGEGIAPDDLDHVFERFWRGGLGAEGQPPGLGLGLSIVREVVRSHGGKVSVGSAVGEGATFTMRLPVAGSLN